MVEGGRHGGRSSFRSGSDKVSSFHLCLPKITV